MKHTELVGFKCKVGNNGEIIADTSTYVACQKRVQSHYFACNSHFCFKMPQKQDAKEKYKEEP